MHYHEISRLCKRAISLLFSLLPALFWVLLLYSFDSPDIAGITLVCALIHEIGHETYLYLRYGRIFMPSGKLNGMKLGTHTKQHLSYKDEAILYAAGPLANVIAALLSLPFLSDGDGYVACFSVINLATAASNLIPIKGYDGYGILRCILAETRDAYRAHAILDSVSFAFTLALCILSLYLIDRFAEGFWVFSVFIFSLLKSISDNLKNVNQEK